MGLVGCGGNGSSSDFRADQLLIGMWSGRWQSNFGDRRQGGIYLVARKDHTFTGTITYVPQAPPSELGQSAEISGNFVNNRAAKAEIRFPTGLAGSAVLLFTSETSSHLLGTLKEPSEIAQPVPASISIDLTYVPEGHVPPAPIP